MTKYVEPTKLPGEPLRYVEIPDGKYCPNCHRSPRVHVSAEWLGRAKKLKAYVGSGRVAFRGDARAELGYLRTELAWVAIERRQEARDDAEWRRALEWVKADEEGVESELIGTISRQIEPRSDETRDEYVSRLRAYRGWLRRLGLGGGITLIDNDEETKRR